MINKKLIKSIDKSRILSKISSRKVESKRKPQVLTKKMRGKSNRNQNQNKIYESNFIADLNMNYS